MKRVLSIMLTLMMAFTMLSGITVNAADEYEVVTSLVDEDYSTTMTKYTATTGWSEFRRTGATAKRVEFRSPFAATGDIVAASEIDASIAAGLTSEKVFKVPATGANPIFRFRNTFSATADEMVRIKFRIYLEGSSNQNVTSFNAYFKMQNTTTGSTGDSFVQNNLTIPVGEWYDVTVIEQENKVHGGLLVTLQDTTGNSAYPLTVYLDGNVVVETVRVAESAATKVAADKAALDLGDTTAVTGNLTLPTAGSVYGSTITWATSDASVITADGKIARVGEDKTATLTATITNGDATDTKDFAVTVPGYEVYNLDLSAENNILSGKTITPITGRYYNSSTPAANKQLATDGDITTAHFGNAKVDGVVTGLSFSVNLEKEYFVDNVKVLLAEKHSNLTIKIYNGSAVDESKLLGTYSAPGTANYVVSGEKEEALVVLSCDLPDFTRASQLTIAYGSEAASVSGNDFIVHEIAATGSEVEEGVTYINFKSSDNLAYGKDNVRVIGHFYEGSNPATDDLATDGDITTFKRCTGAHSGEVVDGKGSYYGAAFKIDLGAYYNLTELTLYTKDVAPNAIEFRSEDTFDTTGRGESGNKGGFILNSLGGELHTNGFATVPEGSGELVNVNGTEVYKNTAVLSETSQPVRYLIVHLCGGTWEYGELYVAGTPATGLAFAEGDFVYAEDAEAGTKTVTAQVSIMNLTEAATNGNLFFAAYNNAGALVGMTKVATGEIAAADTYNTTEAFAVSAKATYVKAFYWEDGTFAPIIADIICD